LSDNIILPQEAKNKQRWPTLFAVKDGALRRKLISSEGVAAVPAATTTKEPVSEPIPSAPASLTAAVPAIQPNGTVFADLITAEALAVLKQRGYDIISFEEKRAPLSQNLRIKRGRTSHLFLR
jgi:hypothetical protein